MRYEKNYLIPTCKKVLNLPGEQHYLVHRNQIEKEYRAKDAFALLSEEYACNCQKFIEFLHDACGYDKNAHGLSGSGALGCLKSTSDFDWVLYTYDPMRVEACIRNSADCSPELTFTMGHVYRKYSVFNGLAKDALDTLFACRWRYFRYEGMRISVNIVNPTARADMYCEPRTMGSRTVFRGEILSAFGCYHFPYVIPVMRGTGIRNVLSWLFLYNGAFATGDSVEISGRVCTVHGQQYVLVEEHDDYIRKLSNEKGK